MTPTRIIIGTPLTPPPPAEPAPTVDLEGPTEDLGESEPPFELELRVRLV